MIHDLVFRYHSPIVKNEISPYQSPSYVFDDTRGQTIEGPEGDDFALFRRPVRTGLCPLCRGSHLLTPDAITSIAFFSFGFAADDFLSLYGRSRPRASRQDAVHGLLHHRKKANIPCLNRPG